MAKWEVQKVDATTINSGNKFNDGDVVRASDLNSVVECALYAQEIQRIDEEEMEQIQKHIPLVIQVLINLRDNTSNNFSYAELKAKLESGEAVRTWKRSDFNRDALIGDEFFAVARTSDDYIVGINAYVTQVESDGRPVFKIIDLEIIYNPDEITLTLVATLDVGKTYNYLLDMKNNQSELYSDGINTYWFNRVPKVDDRFFGIARTKDKRIIGFTGVITRVAMENNVRFAWYRYEDLELLGEDYPILNRTMAFNGVSPEEFVAQDGNGDYTFKGTAGHHSIHTNLFSVPPRVGNNFFGTVVLRNEETSPTYSIATFTALVTAVVGEGASQKAEWELVDATILHRQSVDDAIETIPLVANVTYSYDKQYDDGFDFIPTQDSEGNWLYRPMIPASYGVGRFALNRDAKKGDIFSLIGVINKTKTVFRIICEIIEKGTTSSGDVAYSYYINDYTLIHDGNYDARVEQLFAAYQEITKLESKYTELESKYLALEDLIRTYHPQN